MANGLFKKGFLRYTYSTTTFLRLLPIEMI